MKNFRSFRLCGMAQDTGAEGGQIDAQERTEETNVLENGMTFDETLKRHPEYQAEFDRRTTKALNTAKNAWELDKKAAVQAAREEAQRLAMMSAQERAALQSKEKEEELSRREAALLTRELRADAARILTEKGLPTGLIEAVNLDDQEGCLRSVESVEKAFRAAVQEGVEARLKGHAPQRSGRMADLDELSDAEYYKAIRK